MKKIKIAMAGYGNVGRAFANMLGRRKEYIENNYGVTPVITAVFTARRGALIDSSGIDIRRLDEGGYDAPSETGASCFDRSLSTVDVIDKYDYDVLLELTPLDIRTGQPATDHVRHALERGKHVITANKGPIAWHYRELKTLAESKNVNLCYEATLMDGVPVYNLVRETLKGCIITEVKGIFNATTNFLLKELENGIDFDEALRKGREEGFVEADPSLDIDGWDAAGKLTALMNVVMDAHITPMEIDRTGIRDISHEDIAAAKAAGKRYKLLCRGHIDADGKPVGTVSPQLVDAASIYNSINSTESSVTLTTDLMGDVTVIEHEFHPDIEHTAYGVLSDLLYVLDHSR